MKMGAGCAPACRLLAIALVCGALAGCGGQRATATPTEGLLTIAPTVVAVEPTPTTASGVTALPPNPLISRGKPVFASPDVANASGVVDGHYCTQPGWHTGTFPTWLAINVGAGPSRLLLSWNSGYTDDYTGPQAAATTGIPATYTLETSADSTNGADGTWQTVARVQGNDVRTRAHSFPFEGASWVRMTVASLAPGTSDERLTIDEIDVHDTSQGEDDTVFFLGDSITVAAHQRCDTVKPSFAAQVHSAYPDYFPAMIDGGVGGVTSAYGLKMIDQLLAENPDYQVWAIGYGTNDVFQPVTPETFGRQMQAIIDQVRAAGKVPVLARIPYTKAAGKDSAIQALNGVIDRLTTENGLTPGPDLYNWFKAHPDELAPDGIHPEYVGSKSISRLWLEALRSRYEAR